MNIGDEFYQNGLHGIQGGISKVTYLGVNPVKPKEYLFMGYSHGDIYSVDMSNEYIYIGDEIGARKHAIQIIEDQLDSMKTWLQQAINKQRQSNLTQEIRATKDRGTPTKNDEPIIK